MGSSKHCPYDTNCIVLIELNLRNVIDNLYKTKNINAFKRALIFFYLYAKLF